MKQFLVFFIIATVLGLSPSIARPLTCWYDADGLSTGASSGRNGIPRSQFEQPVNQNRNDEYAWAYVIPRWDSLSDCPGKLAGVAAPDPISGTELTSASCLVQNQIGHAECAAICPAGKQVLNCTHSVGNLSSGDTCTSLSRVFSGGTDASGQPNPQPHDRCTVYAICSNGGQSLSAQGWATCY